jgi:hypothetical protein
MSVEIETAWASDNTIVYVSDGTGSDWGPVVTLSLAYKEAETEGFNFRTIKEINEDPQPGVVFLTPDQAREVGRALIADADRMSE